MQCPLTYSAILRRDKALQPCMSAQPEKSLGPQGQLSSPVVHPVRCQTDSDMGVVVVHTHTYIHTCLKTGYQPTLPSQCGFLSFCMRRWPGMSVLSMAWDECVVTASCLDSVRSISHWCGLDLCSTQGTLHSHQGTQMRHQVLQAVIPPVSAGPMHLGDENVY